MTLGKALQPILQLAFAALLSATTLVFGAMPLLWLRRSSHPLIYIAWCAVTVGIGSQIFGMELWAPFLINAVLVYLFVLFESLWVDLLIVSSFSVFLTASMTVFSLILWLNQKGMTLATFFRAKAEEFALQLGALQPSVKIDVEALLPQLPSAFLILMALSIWIALLSESPWTAPSAKEESELKMTRLQAFRVPEGYIWIFLAAMLLALGDFGLGKAQLVAINVLYISVIIYLFQGLAVIGTFFQWQRVGQAWQVLAYIIFITQLFLAVAGLGLIDFWLDFRNRMVKKSAQRISEVEQ